MISREQDVPTDFAPDDFLSSFFRTVKAVLLVPGFFYERMKTNGGLRNPFVFLISCVLIHALIVGLFTRNQATIAFHVINEFLFPFAAAGILFFIITRLFKASGTYEAVFRINAYAAATALFSWIPLIGLFVQFYRFYLITIGLSRAFSIRGSQAVIAIVITVIIYVFALGPIMTQILGSQWLTAAP